MGGWGEGMDERVRKGYEWYCVGGYGLEGR